MTNKQAVLDMVAESRLVAIIRLDDLRYALELTRALLDGGVRALEFTLTNRDSLQVIRDVRSKFSEFTDGEAVVGAGTVVTLDDAQASIAAGSQFIVSPSLNMQVIECCVAENIPNMPGAYTPTEIVTAWEAGADVVKVFPARALGPNYIKDVLAPLPHLKLMPTGGVNLDNMPDYFGKGAFCVGVGSNLFDKQSLASGDWYAISKQAAVYVQQAKCD